MAVSGTIFYDVDIYELIEFLESKNNIKIPETAQFVIGKIEESDDIVTLPIAFNTECAPLEQADWEEVKKQIKYKQ